MSFEYCDKCGLHYDTDHETTPEHNFKCKAEREARGIQSERGGPAAWMLYDGITSTPTVFNKDCEICVDPEFAQMGLPLCFPCIVCGAHVQVDGDQNCDNGHPQPTCPEDELEIRLKYDMNIPRELLILVWEEWINGIDTEEGT